MTKNVGLTPTGEKKVEKNREAKIDSISTQLDNLTWIVRILKIGEFVTQSSFILSLKPIRMNHFFKCFQMIISVNGTIIYF